MKYMGSKRALLARDLGGLLAQVASGAGRVVDLFTGSGAVAWHVARNHPIPVLAVDLQDYSTVLAEAVVGRTGPVSALELEMTWLKRCVKQAKASRFWTQAGQLDATDGPKRYVHDAREFCSSASGKPILTSYGGHYFSPRQALLLDTLRSHLPEEKSERSVCLAALIQVASQCAAAPGHTAQPFGLTDRGTEYLLEAWNRDPVERCQKALRSIAPIHARVLGEARTADALDIAGELNSSDVAFVDPPYSDVQYSRFYHVLETIARGHAGDVSGVGRYPPRTERPQSDFSKKSTSRTALYSLLEVLAGNGVTAVMTFPHGQASNGLSGDAVLRLAEKHFEVGAYVSNGRFSTLGGNNHSRVARTDSAELVMRLTPKS